MMLAEISQVEIWMLVSQLIMAICTVGGLIYVAVSFNKKQEVKVEQPVTITITEELHKVFASKEAFEKHVDENTKRHAEIFSKIGGVERGASNSLENKIEVVRKDVMEISNQVAAVEAKTDSQNQQLARMDAKLDRLAERKL